MEDRHSSRHDRRDDRRKHDRDREGGNQRGDKSRRNEDNHRSDSTRDRRDANGKSGRSGDTRAPDGPRNSAGGAKGQRDSHMTGVGKGEHRDHGDGRRVRKAPRMVAERRDRNVARDRDDGDDNHDQADHGGGEKNKQHNARSRRYGIYESNPDEEMPDAGPVTFDPVGGQELQLKMHDAQGKDEHDAEFMMRVLGFMGFKSTKEKKIPGNDRNYGAHIVRARKYRQYMNRQEGFNRPLDEI